jgi:hypothetical protein
MSKSPATGTRVWWMIFPFIVGAGAFAIGGIGPGVFAFVLAGICSVIAARFDKRSHVRVGDRISAQAREGMSEQFRRWWLVSVIAVAVGVTIVYVGVGVLAGTVALVCGILFVAGGAGALAITRDR